MILRWPGSKWRSAKSIIACGGHFNEFRELMLGGGGVFWRLPKWEFRRIWLNDLNPDPINVCRALQGEDPDFTRRAIHYCTTYRTVTQVIDIWPVMIDRFILHGDYVAYWWINRYAVMGIVSRTRLGVASLPREEKLAAYVQTFRPRRFTEEFWCARRSQLQGVELTVLDYRDVLAEPSAHQSYCLIDPPYKMKHHKSCFYERTFSDEQYVELRDAILSCNHRVLVTLGTGEPTESVFGGAPFVMREHFYTRAGRPNATVPKRGSELFILNRQD